MKEKVDQEELLRIFPGKLRKRIEEKVSFEEVTAVSYTNLDVYKRQVCGNGGTA